MPTKNNPLRGGTRFHDAEQGEHPPYVPPLIDPSEIFNCPMPTDPNVDARLFGDDRAAALAHKHRPYTDPQGRRWVSNLGTDKPLSANMRATIRGLHVGEPRPTTSPEGTLERLKAEGVVGLYIERPTT